MHEQVRILFKLIPLKVSSVLQIKLKLPLLLDIVLASGSDQSSSRLEEGVELLLDLLPAVRAEPVD